MKRLLYVILVIMITSAAILTSCTEPTSTTSATTTSTPTTSPDTTSPKYGGTLTMIRYDSPGTAGGWPATVSGQELCAQTCLEGLLHFDNNGNILPWLAESYELADDHKSITFGLRKDVQFHDGTDFNAQAAKWNIDNMIAAKVRPEWTSVDIIDDYTIRVNFDEWTVVIYNTFADSCYSWMVSPTAFEEHGQDWMTQNPVGTGPFKFESFARDSNYVVVRNDNYWQEGKPYLDEIEVLFISDALSASMSWQSGIGDVMQISTGKVASEIEELGYELILGPLVVHCYVPDSAHSDSPFADQKVREAVEYAIDRDAIAAAFSYGLWPAPSQIAGTNNNIYNPDFSLAREYDPDKARDLLADAGYADGFETTIVHWTGSYERDMFVAVQNYLEAVGIKATLSFPADMGAVLEESNSVVSMLAFQPISIYGNSGNGLNRLLGPNSRMNQNWYRSSEFLGLLEEVITSSSIDLDLIWATTDQLSSEAAMIPVMQQAVGYAVRDYVMGDALGTRNHIAWWNPEQAWLNE